MESGWVHVCGGVHAPAVPAIINLINQLVEPMIDPLPRTHCYPQLQVMPEADCKRYELLYAPREVMA